MIKKVISTTFCALFSLSLIMGAVNTNSDNNNTTAFAGAIQAPQITYGTSTFAGATEIAAQLTTVEVSTEESDVEATALSMVDFEEAVEEVEEVVEKVEENIASAYNVPVGEGVCDADKFTYMSYKTITSKSSVQYKVNYDSNTYTDDKTGVRMMPCNWDKEEDYYLVAIGQGYGFVAGDKIRIYFADGTSVMAIVGDMKAVDDTDPTMRYQKEDGSVVELIVDGKLKQRPDAFEGHGNVVSIEELVLG